ncbi:MAG: DUF2079 domain-containing protein [Thermoleophilia bacterium]
MTAKDFFQNRVVATALVAVSGFASGAVLVPSVLESTGTRTLGTYLPAGLSGSLGYVLFWLTASIFLSMHYREEYGTVIQRSGAIFAAGLLPLISYFPYFLYRSNLSGDSITLPPLGTRLSAILLVIWSMLLLSLLLRMILGPQESRLLSRLTRRPGWTLAIIMAAWLVIFFALDVIKLRYMQVNEINSAVYREAMVNTFDERGFMWSNLLYSNGASLFGVHINPIFQVILPIFLIWPDYRWLLLISDIALVLSAWPAYLIARRRFFPALSLLLAAMVLFNPIMTAQPGFSDFSEVRFIPLLFLTAFYLFEKKRFWLFAATSLLLMMVREDMGLLAAMFGIFALTQRRSLKWIIAPLAWGFGWFWVMGAVVLPRLGPSDVAVRASMRYGNLGSSGSEIIRTIFFRPWVALQAAVSTPSHIGVLYGIVLISGAGTAFLSWAAVFTLPVLAELLLQERTTFVSFMAVPLVPTMAVAFFIGLSKIDRIGQHRYGRAAGRTASIAAVFFFFLACSAFHTWFNPDLYKPRYNYDAALEAFNQVPEDAALMMPEFMLAYGRPDQTVRGFRQVKYQNDLEGRFILKEDYVILDRRKPARVGGDAYYYDGIDQVAAIVSESTDFQKVLGRDDIELYVRKGIEPSGKN